MAQADQFNQFAGDDNHGASFSSKSLNQKIDVSFGTHIDATSGFIKHDNARVRVQEFGQHQFLLIPPG
ncbi:hypothetical protein D3C78_1821840 [compost metagenome]